MKQDQTRGRTADGATSPEALNLFGLVPDSSEQRK